MQIEVARMDDGKGFKNYTFKSVLTTSAGSVTLTSGTISMGSGGNESITMTVQSTTNLFATAGNVEAKISVTAPETGSTGLYIKRGQTINLISKNTSASSAGAQTCTIHYIQ
jgi:PKD repeat protein